MCVCVYWVLWGPVGPGLVEDKIIVVQLLLVPSYEKIPIINNLTRYIIYGSRENH